MSKFAKYLVFTSVLIFTAFGIANAQVGATLIKAHIPNSFVVRGKVLPAGDYTIRRTATTADSPSLLVLQGEGGSLFFDTIATTSTTAAKDTKLIFEKVDNMLYLSEIWVRGQTIGNQLVGARADALKVAKAKAAKSKGDTTGL